MKHHARIHGTHTAAPLGLTLLAALAATTLGSAAVSVGETQIGGFFSQGYLHSSGTNYPVETRGGTADFREMAVNVSRPFGARLRLGAQAFAQKLGKYGDDKLILDWAVADYNFHPAFGVRAGRVKLPGGLYNEALDLDVTRPFIFLPQSVYDVRLRDFNASFDGGMLYGAPSLGSWGGLEYKAYYGTQRVRTESTSGVSDYFRNTGLFVEPGHADIDAVWGGALVWNTPVSGLRVSATVGTMEGFYVTGPFSMMPATDVTIRLHDWRRWVASVEYLVGDWTFAAEWKDEGGDASTLNPAIGLNERASTSMDGWYVSAARRLNHRFELGAYVSSADMGAGVGSSRQDDYALSLRADVSDHVLFKVEAHYIDGTAMVFNVPGVDNSSLDRSFALFAAKVTFSF